MKKTLALLTLLSLLLMACSGGGGDAADDAAPETAASADAGYTVLGAEELDAMMKAEDVYLVNVHVPYEGELPDTDAFIPYTEIVDRLDELPFDEQTVVIYCRSGNMSTEAANAMVAAGAPPFYELGGGWYSWEAAGLPFEVN